jgi:MFS family permease
MMKTTKNWQVGSLSYTTAGLGMLFALLLVGDFAWSMRDRSVGPMSQWYLNSQKVPAFVFGLLFSSLPAIIGLVVGPYISVKSDRHRGPRGRRIPFLLVVTPIAALGMVGLSLTPYMVRAVEGVLSGDSGFATFVATHVSPAILGWVLDPVTLTVIFFTIFWCIFEVASIASQPIFTGLINDVVPRPLIGRFYGLFRAISLIDGMIFNYWLMGLVPTYFTGIMLGIGIFYGVAFQIVCFRIREGTYPDPASSAQSVPDRAQAGRIAGIKVYFRECFTNPFYVAVFFLMMTAALAFSPVNTFAIPYATSLNLDMKVYGKFLAITYVISLSLSFVLGWLADKFHPLRMAIAAQCGYLLVTLWGSLYAETVNAFLVAWVLHGVISGCYFTGAATLGQRLYPHSKFAQFASAAGILVSLGSMVLGPVVGILIDASGKMYRLSFASAAVLSATSLILGFYVYHQFKKLGGVRHYVAPLEAEPAPDGERDTR